MGGCCCRLSKNAESDRASVYFYCLQNLGEHEQLSSASDDAISGGILVDINLDTSTPDTYRSPPPPLPYDVVMPCSQTLPRDAEICGSKGDNRQTADSQFGCGSLESSDICEAPDKSDSKRKPQFNYDSGKLIEDDVQKPITSYEEDICPICLEEYDSENPQIMTQCEHEFHLSCILEWMERSDTCPICDQIMVFDNEFGV